MSNIAATGLFQLSVVQRGLVSRTPLVPRNPELDQTIAVGLISENTVTILGTWLNLLLVAGPITITVSQQGSKEIGQLLSSSALFADLDVELLGDVTIEAAVRSWVSWSNIGSLDFTIWKDNIAGKRPLDWKGWVYAIRKLGSRVMVYGQNGVSILPPVGNTYGLQTIHRVGLKGRGASCGTEQVQFFIDAEGCLYKIEEKLELLDYREYLSSLLSSVVMSYDEKTGLIYICDGLQGFVYSSKDLSLGSGPVNITGVGYQDGVQSVAASSTIATPVFELCTDIYDLGSRKNKTIHSLEIGTDETETLYAAISWRADKAEAFQTTPWKRVNPNGITPIPCFGVEFKFHLKMLTYTYFELDYIRVNGVVHGYSYLDSFDRSRSA